MKGVSVKGGLVFALLMLTACGGVDDATGAEQPLPEETRSEEGALAPGDCIFYRCPVTGRTFSGRTDYEAGHRCGLNCTQSCTFVENICA
ncbi:hypothetical protein LZ198_25915 [Myxococcus sp. K15C18031901]|uniref:hypothetical protein n=1 Tax=Myxococcus dinghuensis TaxID=2906761 RepID=UPI0020A837C0|nr:hypothetical protein [Myxococcus dinghuensis]MCP3102312.1 hypothetical protein [Myxococcus dinghuensis]